MAQIDPIMAGAIITGIGSGIGYVGKQIFNLISNTIHRESTRADRLEEKLFSTQALVYPVLEAANAAIREAIAVQKDT